MAYEYPTTTGVLRLLQIKGHWVVRFNRRQFGQWRSPDAAAIAVVRRYVHQKKHWRASDYQIRRDRVEGRRTVFHVTYLPDRKRAPMVGGGKSFEAFYDPARQKVTQVLYFQ